MKHAQSFELASGANAVRAGQTTRAVPQARQQAWSEFRAEVGPGWQGLFTPATEGAFYLYGPGLPVPGSVREPGVARAYAADFLARHIELLAPGAAAADMVVTHDLLIHQGKSRHIGFQQTYRGLDVIEGYVTFLFKSDRMFVITSNVTPGIDATVSGARVSDATAQLGARRWIARDYGTNFAAGNGTVGEVSGPYILPVTAGKRDQLVRGNVQFHTVLAVPVSSAVPEGGWRVYVDAATGEPVARQQTLFFADGRVGFRLGKRRPGTELQDVPALNTNTSAGQTDATGTVDVGGGGSITLRTEGPRVRISNTSGGNVLEATVSASPGTLSAATVSQTDLSPLAVYTTFVYMNWAKEFVRDLNPGLSWLNSQTTANVNINNTCNASFGGNTGNFFRRGSGCENTGALADVVMHELGHGVHGASLIGIPFNGAISEAHGDILATTIAGEPNLGEGFFLDNPSAGLRELDPPGEETRWSVLGGSGVHTAGTVYGGAMWDFRKLMVSTHGEAAGVTTYNNLWYASVQRAGSIPTAHLALREADDDDGDLTNGTPNGCLITAAFEPHEIAGDVEGGGSPSVATPVVDGLTVSVQVLEPTGACVVASPTGAELQWRLRDAPATSGTVTMSLSGDTFSGAIPPQDPDTVVNYKLVLTFDDSSTRSLPSNPADQWYELYVGTTEEIYCARFDSNPTDWATGAVAGSNDWEWGPASGSADDPAEAYTGTNVFGNALGGQYANSATTFAEITVPGLADYEVVRLQYRRWLTVEDGFFDQATILVNGTPAWTNLNTDMGNDSNTHHIDREWRFQDLDLTSAAAGGEVTVRFELATDGGLTFGGWTLDDVCIVGIPTGGMPPACGDGTVDPGEECDDNNTTDGDGCSSTCQNEGGPGTPDAGTGPDTPDAGPGPGGDDSGVGNPDNNDDGTASGGCGCQADGGSPAGSLGLLFAFGALVLVRRRCRW